MTASSKPKLEELYWDIFVTAIESGIYGVQCWSALESYKSSEQNKADAEAVITDAETGKRHTITLATIKRAMSKINKADTTKETDLGMHRSYLERFHAAHRRRDSDGELDGPDCDLIVQVGLFGEVLYS